LLLIGEHEVPEVPKRGWPEAEPQPSPEQMQMAAAQLAQASGVGDIDVKGKGPGFDPEEGPEWTEEAYTANVTKQMSGLKAFVKPERFTEAQQGWTESEDVLDWREGSVHKKAAETAQKALGLTPQERALYDLHLSNLWGKGGVDHPDGSRSTLLRVSFEHDGKTYNVPSVYDGKVLSPKEAVERALDTGIGQFPSYRSRREADARYEQMHRYMESDTADYFTRRGR
jgi:hypothetical protein